MFSTGSAILIFFFFGYVLTLTLQSCEGNLGSSRSLNEIA